MATRTTYMAFSMIGPHMMPGLDLRRRMRHMLKRAVDRQLEGGLTLVRRGKVRYDRHIELNGTILHRFYAKISVR